MTRPREISRFSIPPEGRADDRMMGLPGMPPGYSGATVAGPPSKNLFTVAWRSRQIILICVAVAIVAGLVYIRVAPPIYTSTAKLYLDYVNVVPPASELGRLPQTEKYLQTQVGLLKSRPIVSAALEALAEQPLRTFRDVDVPTAFVAKTLRVEVGKKDDIINIAFDAPFPVEAAQIVNSVVEAYMTSRSRHKQRDAAQMLEILQKDLSRVDKERAQKQAQLEEFQKNNMPMALGSEVGGTLMQRQLGALQAELARAQTAAMEAESFRDTVKALAANAGALQHYVQEKSNVRSSLYPATERSALESRLTETDLQLKELSDRLTPDHPAVATLRDQRAVIQARLTELDERFAADITAAADQQYLEARDHMMQLMARYEEQRKQIMALSAEIAEYQRLRSAVDRLTTYGQTLETQVGEMARIVDEDVGQFRMAILESALPAEKPSAPRKGKVMAMALALALLLGGGIAVTRDWFDQTFRSVDEVGAVLQLPVLGVIPMMPRRMSVSARGQQVFLRPDSQEAEVFRTVRTAVFFGAPQGEAMTLLVTSPGAGDGKSTLVSNLAIAMAMAGQRTIVVDANLRGPAQQAIFEIHRRGPCLEDVLGGRARLAEAIHTVKASGLSVLACRRGLRHPAEIVSSPSFAKLLEHLAKTYHRVLVDTPPVTVVTDAQILSAVCDFTILVLRANKTTGKMAQEALDALQSVGANILGVVVNQITRSGNRYGYRGWYERACGSGSNGNGDKARETRVPGRNRHSVAGMMSSRQGWLHGIRRS